MRWKALAASLVLHALAAAWLAVRVRSAGSFGAQTAARAAGAPLAVEIVVSRAPPGPGEPAKTRAAASPPAQTARRAAPSPKTPAPVPPARPAAVRAADGVAAPARPPHGLPASDRPALSEIAVPAPGEVAELAMLRGGIGVQPDLPPSRGSPAPALPLVPLPTPAAPERRPSGPRFAPDGEGGYFADAPAFGAHVERDGSIHFQDKASIRPYTWWLPLYGSFDITDMVLRAHGTDPYAYQKRKLAEQSFAWRLEMAEADRTDRLQRALAALPGMLDAIWRANEPAAARRQALFELWDDCAEPGEAGGDAETARAGEEARALVLSFVRARLPPGATYAYGAEELAALNRRRSSRAEFAPYGPAALVVSSAAGASQPARR